MSGRFPMEDDQSVVDQLRFVTFPIEADGPDGVRVGTGFMYDVFPRDADPSLPLLVTNRHVVEDASAVHFLAHTTLRDTSESYDGQVIEFQTGPYETDWISHPEPGVDLAATPLAPLGRQLRGEPFKMGGTTLTPDLIHVDGDPYSTQEPVTMIGYPTGVFDTEHNFPIFRSGSTATHPLVDYCGEPLFAVDIAVFPGSSGSPLVVTDAESSPDGRPALLGVLSEAEMRKTGEARVRAQVPTDGGAEGQLLHLGYAIQARKLEGFGEDIVRTAVAEPDELYGPA